ncbi:Crp/Fnr family transcriptional regulator [Synechococcus sp. RSCCF101]|uniref:Crp/Fnr family transcriptional regulator n=1 Tax=Synechococcus sp. RSCCF101 TaxID=2511069 RepID=UPI00124653A5|nr:Crp/Fnr family transcriptional regulator [Synechococcus sp. RSCCF101]QEY31376.1 Crp/Fnr family transcriptional regulator [Synechococcus sp. RSCCF101]
MHALETMKALAASGDTIHLSAGASIFRAGDAGSTMYGILEGTVRLSWDGDRAHEDLTAGDVFGAGALVVDDHTRFGTAIASSDCGLIVMNREKFLFAVQETPMFAIQLLASIDERLRSLKRAAVAA